MNKNQKSPLSVFREGIIDKNPLLVSMLGVCPALATSTTVKNGLTMGLVVLAVLLLSNITVSIFRSIIPDRIRIPVFMIIIAGYVCATEMLLKAYLPAMDKSLGFYISLVVVNCVVLSRSEQFAYKNNIGLSIVDAIANGIGYTVVLVILSFIREALGKGSVYGYDFSQYIGFNPINVIVAPAGGFFILALLCALLNKLRMIRRDRNA